MIIANNEFRAELNNGYCYVRSMKNENVIDSMIPENKIKKVREILAQSHNMTFGQVWDKLNLVKGTKFENRID